MNPSLFDQLPLALLVKGSAISLVLFFVAGVRRAAPAEWTSLWWRAGFTGLIALAGAGLFPSVWHIAPPSSSPVVSAGENLGTPVDVGNLATPVPPTQPSRAAIQLSTLLRVAWAFGGIVVLGRAANGALRIRRDPARRGTAREPGVAG